MIRSVAATVSSAALLASCSTSTLSVDSSTSQAAVALAEKRAGDSWWRQLNDASLDRDIVAAFSDSPGLSAVSQRVEQADATVAGARAASLPRLNVNLGYREGRKKEIDFGPYDLAPWEGGAGLSWEIDVTGKLRAVKKAASENRSAAVWDYHASRLLLAGRIADVRMNLYRFNAEIANLGEALSANKRTLDSLSERSQAGLIPDSVLDKQRAEDQRLKRTQLDLQRLRDLTIVQLRTLRGGTDPSDTTRDTFPTPDSISRRPIDQLLASHPTILAAEARVRSAFQLERSAHLDLLPSFRINLLAGGTGAALTDHYATWVARVGPSLNIPIYDPVRIAAVNYRKAEAKIAASEYRQAVLEVLGEIDTASINLASHRAQLTTAKNETQALARTRKNAREQFDAGLISQVEYLDTERSWLDAKRSQAAIQQALLSARINLIKATGGARL